MCGCVECFVSMNVVMIALSLVLIKYDSSNWEQNLEVLQDKGRINEEFILQWKDIRNQQGIIKYGNLTTGS